MSRNFENQFSRLQADMVSVCLEYGGRMCEQVYIHIICENDSIFTNFFFRAGGIMIKKSKLNGASKDISFGRQKAALSFIAKYVEEIIKLCAECSQPVPSEFRLVYDVGTGSLKADYGYGPVTSLERTDRVVSDAWFSQLENNICTR